MKELLNYHEPLTGRLKESFYLLTENEFYDQAKILGLPEMIEYEFPNTKPSPFKIEGEGWIVEDESGYGITSIYIRNKTHKVTYL